MTAALTSCLTTALTTHRWVDDDAFVQQLGVHPAEWLEGVDLAVGNQTNGVKRGVEVGSNGGQTVIK